MNIQEQAKRARAALNNELKTMKSAIEAENRNPNADERDHANKLLALIDAIEAPVSEPVKPNPMNHNGQFGAQRAGGQTMNGPAIDRTYRGMFCPNRESLDRGGFKDANEFLTVIESARYDERLVRSSMGGDVPSQGGFAVPEQFAAKWLDDSLPNEIVRNRAQVWPMSTVSRKIPGWDGNDRSSSLYGGFNMQWLAEKASGTRQTGKLRLLELKSKKGAIYCQISNELKDDGMGFEQQLEAAIKKSIGFGLDEKFFFGSGAGVPAGALSTANPALITVSPEVGQTSGIVYENVAKMYARLAPGCHKNAVFHANQTAIVELLTLSLPVQCR